MSMVPLHPGLPGGRYAVVRELRGEDELLSGEGAGTALVDRVLERAEGTTVGPGRAPDLALCDRDRVLAEVYRREFGDEIESVGKCRACETPFEVTFSLAELQRRLLEAGGAADQSPCDDAGWFTLPQDPSVRFRLPTSRDLAVAALSVDPVMALFEMCTGGRVDRSRREEVERQMQRAGGIVATDIPVECAECGAPQKMHFDMPSFLMSRLERERAWLHHEVHCLAVAYRWGHGEILALPRAERRAYVKLVAAGGKGGKARNGGRAVA